MDDAYKLRTAYQRAEIEALHQLLAAMLRALPHDAIRAVQAEIRMVATGWQVDAEDGDRDDLRDRASAAYDLAEFVRRVADTHITGETEL